MSLLSSTLWVGVDVVNIDSTVCKGVSDAMRRGGCLLVMAIVQLTRSRVRDSN